MSDEAKPGEGKTHFLKTWPQFFSAIADGSKPFEARKDDRDPPFAVGDELCLQEFVPGTGGGFTGKELDRKVSYILRGTEHVAPGYCILGLQSEQLADLTARLKQAEAERDAARARIEELEKDLKAVRGNLSETKYAAKHERDRHIRHEQDTVQLLEQRNSARQQRDAALAKLAAVEKEEPFKRGTALIHSIGAEARDVIFMAASGSYAMVRRKGCMAYIANLKDLSEI